MDSVHDRACRVYTALVVSLVTSAAAGATVWRVHVASVVRWGERRHSGLFAICWLQMLVVRQELNYSSPVRILPAPGPTTWWPHGRHVAEFVVDVCTLHEMVKTGTSHFDDVLIHWQFMIHPHTNVSNDIDCIRNSRLCRKEKSPKHFRKLKEAAQCWLACQKMPGNLLTHPRSPTFLLPY